MSFPAPPPPPTKEQLAAQAARRKRLQWVLSDPLTNPKNEIKLEPLMAQVLEAAFSLVTIVEIWGKRPWRRVWIRYTDHLGCEVETGVYEEALRPYAWYTAPGEDPKLAEERRREARRPRPKSLIAKDFGPPGTTPIAIHSHPSPTTVDLAHSDEDDWDFKEETYGTKQ